MYVWGCVVCHASRVLRCSALFYSSHKGMVHFQEASRGRTALREFRQPSAELNGASAAGVREVCPGPPVSQPPWQRPHCSLTLSGSWSLARVVIGSFAKVPVGRRVLRAGSACHLTEEARYFPKVSLRLYKVCGGSRDKAFSPWTSNLQTHVARPAVSDISRPGQRKGDWF